MYWTRSLLKQNAKQVLRESYWRVFLAWLLISLGAGAAAGVLSNIVLFVPTLVVSLATIGSPEAYLAGILFVYLLFLVFILVFNALVTMPLTVGGEPVRLSAAGLGALPFPQQGAVSQRGQSHADVSSGDLWLHASVHRAGHRARVSAAVCSLSAGGKPLYEL